eukprot:CAMPEP_0198719400 /NCGR_PEP_ID=MMETSP1471-20131121/56184_1 /TAXON_ID=41880 /ORGANISM="Pycnococcus provasolii, Strain RCC733" /LENGTH=77 /DNA_ID=CAMNT_0044480153 /DNA_START=62 /DNA_END=291 /DNA_ORIENTATION=+
MPCGDIGSTFAFDIASSAAVHTGHPPINWESSDVDVNDDDVDGGDADDDALHASWKNDDSYASGKNCVWSACSCAAS